MFQSTHPALCDCVSCSPDYYLADAGPDAGSDRVEVPMKSITVWIDGGCRNNGTPQAEGYGSVLIQGREDNMHRLSFDNAKTNNQAEYGALLAALDLLNVLLEPRFAHHDISIVVNTDSALLHNQVTGAWKTKSRELQGLRDAARHGIQLFENAPNIEFRIEKVARGTIEHHLGH
jgi:ribonuclease HI